MVTTKLNLSMTEPQVRQIYAKQGDTGRVLDISLDQTPEDGTLRILRPDGVEVTSEAVTGGEGGETFETLAEADVTELTVGIEPVQDLNGYDKPWVGGAGTNKYDDSAKTNALINEQGAETTNSAWCLSDYCAIPLGTTKVTLSWQSETTYYQGRVVAYDSSKAFISGSFVAWAGTAQSHTFDVPSTASYVRVNYSHIVSSQESPRNNVRLNVGTSDLGYSPYSNICPITGHDEVTVNFGAEQGTADETYTTSLGQTVYGGTLDMVTGQLVVDKAIVDLGSLTWTKDVSLTRFYAYLNGAKAPASNNDAFSGISSAYNSVSLNSLEVNTGDGLMALSTGANLSVRDLSLMSSTAAEFKTAVTGRQLVYELATPQTYTLTAQQIKTLVGTNNVWASSGDIVNITFTYGGLLSELPSEATEIVGKCYCDVEQNGVSSMPFTLNVKKNERES